MVLCGLVTLILIPALLPRRIPPRRPPSLNMPALASWVLSHRTAIVAGAALLTVALGAAALQIHVNPTLDRLRSVTPAAAALDRIGLEFGLPRDVFVVLHRGRDLDSLLASDEHLSGVVVAALPSVPMQAASALLPSESAQRSRAEAVRGAALSSDDVAAELARTAAAEGFKQDSFAPFQKRLPQLLATESRLTYDGYLRHGLSDLIGRFVRKDGEEWLLASYVFPSTDTEVAQLERLVSDAGNGVVLTGLPLVNHELAERFLPQFLKGLGIGSLIVVMLIVWTFRDWRLSLLSLAPAVIGLVWAAGLLALARVELDLFAVFAVVTFVGIGVDYGVHLVHRYRERRDATQAIGELAPVILVAAAITLLGYGTLVTSSYPPLRSIGLVSIVTVLTLAAASLFLLPALLPASTTTLKAAATPAERRTRGHA
jgi:hypothetical protein